MIGYKRWHDSALLDRAAAPIGRKANRPPGRSFAEKAMSDKIPQGGRPASASQGETQMFTRQAVSSELAAFDLDFADRPVSFANKPAVTKVHKKDNPRAKND